jgi:ribonuclease P protein component
VALPRVHRLRQRRDFSAVYQSGLRRSTAHLTLRGLRESKRLVISKASECSNANQSKADQSKVNQSKALVLNDQPTRIGISISQKVSKRAVVRNLIRRRIRSALRQLLPRLAPGWRLVIVVQPQAIECGYEQFLQELEQLLVEAGVIHGN